MPVLDEPTLTEEQTFFVSASASGMLSMNERSKEVILLFTSAEYPPKKSMPHVSAALSNAFASAVSRPGKFAARILAGVTDTLLLMTGIPYSSPSSRATFTIFSAFLHILS